MSGFAKSESGGIDPVRNLLKFGQPLRLNSIVSRVLNKTVNGFPIDFYHCGYIMNAFHAPFDFKAVQTAVHQIRDMRQK